MASEPCWSHLPTLCVAAILDQLTCRDALLASSACTSWRSALSLYNGHRESLQLVAHREHHERNTLLAQLFRKRVRRLRVLLRCRGADLDKFLHLILARFCEAKALEDVEFIAAPQYLRFEENSNIETLRNAITTPLLHSQRHRLRRVALHGCGNLLPLQMQDPEEPTAYCNLRCVAATTVRRAPPTAPVCSDTTVHPFPFSSLQCVAMDFASLDSIAMKGLASLPHLRRLAVNVQHVGKGQARRCRWGELTAYYDLQVELTLNIINLTESELLLLKHYILTEDLPLAAIRIFFCKTLDLELVQSVVDRYGDTLREFLWADAPVDVRPRGPHAPVHPPGNFINPFVMMCWQCPQLERIVIHGYWVGAYDVLGMARLRAASLRRLAVSPLLWEEPPEHALPLLQFHPVHVQQKPGACWPELVAEINDILSFDWKPLTYSDMHPAITPQTTKEHRYNYILQETMSDIGHLPDVT